MLDNLKVTIAQVTSEIKSNDDFENLFDHNNGMKYKSPERQLEYFYKGAKVARDDNANFLVFPELFLPSKYVRKYISHEAERSRTIIIGGLEWIEKPQRYGSRIIENNAFIAIPSVLNKQSLLPISEATVINIPKLYPAPEEEKFLISKNYEFQKRNRIYLFCSKVVGNWAVLICSDYLNLPIQRILQAKIQTLFVVAYNTDLGYFHTLSDTLHRILFCNVVVCNTGDYGGSHAYTPYRNVHKRKRYETMGNHVDSVVTINLPLNSLVEEQKATPQKHNNEFIQKPPNYQKNEFK